MRAIFISYRRDDAEGHAGRLFEDLEERFGKASVFMDVTGIEPGRDFRRVIEQQVASCGVLLAVIGKDWLTATDAEGRRRLDDPADFVCLETATALKRDIPVVPVLVHGARMPRPDQLPDALTDLAFRNGVELSHARWASDVQLLINALLPYVDASPQPASPDRQGLDVAPPGSIAAPPAGGADDPPLRPVADSGRKGAKKASLIVLGAASAVGVAFVGYFVAGRGEIARDQGERTAARPSAASAAAPVAAAKAASNVLAEKSAASSTPGGATAASSVGSKTASVEAERPRAETAPDRQIAAPVRADSSKAEKRIEDLAADKAGAERIALPKSGVNKVPAAARSPAVAAAPAPKADAGIAAERSPVIEPAPERMARATPQAKADSTTKPEPQAPVEKPPAAAPTAESMSVAKVEPYKGNTGLALLGDPASPASAIRTVAIRPDTKYVNVTGGEIVRFTVGDKSFAWNFNGRPSSFDLAAVAPPGMLDHKVTAYVAPNPLYPRPGR